MMYVAESGLVDGEQVVKVRCRPHATVATTPADPAGEGPAIQVRKGIVAVDED